MNDSQRSTIEERLLEERRAAIESLGKLDDRDQKDDAGGDDGELSNYPLHMADDGTDTMEQEKSYLLASQEGRRLYQIDEALRRLYKQPEEFGKCRVCDAEIGMERLDLIPWASTCATHAEQDESSRVAAG